MATHASSTSVADTVKEYYGTVLSSSKDLKTSACRTARAPPPHIAAALTRVHEEVTDRFYGCGSPIPAALDGITVLDLGCGSGRDAYVLSRLVAPNGRVIGVDMTAEQPAVARRHQDWLTSSPTAACPPRSWTMRSRSASASPGPCTLRNCAR